MAEPMSVSMTIKVVDEASAQVRGVAAAYRDLQAAGEAAGRSATGAGTSGLDAQGAAVTRVTTALADEGRAVDDVAGKMSALRGATAQAAAPIAEAIGRLREEGQAVDDLAAKMRALGTAAGAGGHASGAEPGASEGGGVDWGDRAGKHQDWGAYWAAKRGEAAEDGPQKPRASDWVAAQQAVRDYGEEVDHAAQRVEALEVGMARLGMVGMAFGQVRQFGETLARPVEAVDDAFTDFQAKTQDLATRSDNNGGQKAVGDHILKVARDANVAWQQVYEGEQALASLGGGDQLKAMAAYETRMNQLALAGHVETRDVYGAMMHYIKGGLSAADAMDALEQQHVQGKRGSYELTNMARGMPRLMALGREFGMTPKQAAVDTSALLQILRENTGSPEQADVLAQHVMTKLGDPRTMKRLQADLGIDGFADREQAQKEGVNPLFHLLNSIAEKFAHLSEDQKGKVVGDADGHGGAVQGGDPRIMGDLARDYYFRAALDAYIQHRAELPKFDVPIDEARRTTDEDYAAQNATVKQARQAAENRKAEAGLRTGETQAPVMKAVAGAEGAAADAAGKVAAEHPTTVGAATAFTGLVGAGMKAIGQLGEAAIGAVTAWSALQWMGSKVPGGGAVAGVVRAPATALKGFGDGIVEGMRQARAGAAPPAPSGGAAPSVAASGAAAEFGAASSSLGTLAMLAAWASRRDVGMGRSPDPESLRQNPLNIRLPGEPGAPPAGARPASILPEGVAARAVTALVEPLQSGIRAALAATAAMNGLPAPAFATPAVPPPGMARPATTPVAASAVPADAVRAIVDPIGAAIRSAVSSANPATRAADAPPAVAGALGPLTAALQGVIARSAAPPPPPAPPKPTAADQPPQQVTNNNQKTVNAPITVNAPVTINATMNNTTPGAVGAAVGAAIHGGVRAGAGALHDGTETK